MPHEPASPRMERHHLNELTRPVNSKQALRLLQTDGASTADVGGVEWGGGWDLENYTYFRPGSGSLVRTHMSLPRRA